MDYQTAISAACRTLTARGSLTLTTGYTYALSADDILSFRAWAADAGQPRGRMAAGRRKAGHAHAKRRGRGAGNRRAGWG